MNRQLLKTLFEALIASEDSVKVQIDPRVHGVELPKDLLDRTSTTRPRYPDPHKVLLLEYGMGLHLPTNDLDVSERGLEATLSFSRVNHPTFVPWGAVSAVRAGNITLTFEWSLVLHKDKPPLGSPVPAPFGVIDGGKS